MHNINISNSVVFSTIILLFYNNFNDPCPPYLIAILFAFDFILFNGFFIILKANIMNAIKLLL